MLSYRGISFVCLKGHAQKQEKKNFIFIIFTGSILLPIPTLQAQKYKKGGVFGNVYLLGNLGISSGLLSDDGSAPCGRARYRGLAGHTSLLGGKKLSPA